MARFLKKAILATLAIFSVSEGGHTVKMAKILFLGIFAQESLSGEGGQLAIFNLTFW